LPVLSAIGLGPAFAKAILSKIPILGGSKAYIPAFVTQTMNQRLGKIAHFALGDPCSIHLSHRDNKNI
jgi:hypothetical protein